MYYIMRDNICYFSLARRGLVNTFTEVCNFNSKRSKKESPLNNYLLIYMLISEDKDLLDYFLLTYFSSDEFKRDAYFSCKFDPKNEGYLEILADILFCVDHNDGGVVSEILGDSDGVKVSLLVFEKKRGLKLLLSGSNKGKLSTVLPLINVDAIIAENTSVALRMRDGKIYICGNKSSITEDNFDVIFSKNLVDFNR